MRVLYSASNVCTLGVVMLAGMRVPEEDVRELASRVDEPTRSLLEKALALETVVVALTVEDRERILRALDDVRTDALAEFRAVLLHEHEWRVRGGLVSLPSPNLPERGGSSRLSTRPRPSGARLVSSRGRALGADPRAGGFVRRGR
jgi:hypothetical protein